MASRPLVRTAQRLLALLLLVPGGCAWSDWVQSAGNAAPVDSLDAVAQRTYTIYGFRLESGRSLPELTLAYETYGRLAADGRNAILVTHGFMGDHHAAGKHSPADRTPGWWDGLIGRGKAIDTDRYFVVSSNMLGSSYGSTAPMSFNPATGRRYGPSFPDITVRDMVVAQRLLLDGLGVRRLVAVAGPAFGGYQAFQWAATYPEHVLGIVAVATAPKGSGGAAAVKQLADRFAADPNWNSGWHYERGGIPDTMAALRMETLERYGAREVLARGIADPAQREARLREMAEAWAVEFDPNSLIALSKAAVRFDGERALSRVRARVLYVLSRTDRVFPPSIAPAVMDRMATAGIDARYVQIDSDLGHLASGADWTKWAPALKEFLASLER